MARRASHDPDGIITARLADTARAAWRHYAIGGPRSDLLAKQAGLILGLPPACPTGDTAVP